MTSYRIEIEPGAYPEPHELRTAEVLTKFGNVKFLRPNRKKGLRTPDIIWLKQKWEIKSPKGTGRWTLEHSFQSALHQSDNIIMDLQRAKLPQEKCLREIKRQFCCSKQAKNLKIITKKRQIIDYSK